jgi:hypothetical protein
MPRDDKRTAPDDKRLTAPVHSHLQYRPFYAFFEEGESAGTKFKLRLKESKNDLLKENRCSLSR